MEESLEDWLWRFKCDDFGFLFFFLFLFSFFLVFFFSFGENEVWFFVCIENKEKKKRKKNEWERERMFDDEWYDVNNNWSSQGRQWALSKISLKEEEERRKIYFVIFIKKEKATFLKLAKYQNYFIRYSKIHPLFRALLNFLLCSL